MREFSRDNTVRPEKSIRSMNYSEFFEYAHRKIAEELRLCQNKLSSYSNQMNEINKDRRQLEETGNLLSLHNDFENIQYAMGCISNGKNVKEDTENTVYGKKYKDEKYSQQQQISNINRRINALNDEIEKVTKDVRYWEDQLKKYNISNISNPQKPLFTDWWSIYFETSLTFSIIGLILGVISCWNACDWDNEVISCDAISRAFWFFTFGMLIYFGVMAIGVFVYSQMNENTIDWPSNDIH